MRTPVLLAELSSKGIRVWAEGGRLRYRAPKGALTPDLREQLVDRKAEILALLDRVDATAEPAPPPLERVSRDRPLALSLAQARLWFLDQLEPGSTAYSIPNALRLRGALDLPALERSLNELVRRHETLRTVFVQNDDEPVQVILPELELPVPLVDLQSLPGAEREAEMQRLRAREAQTPFDLAAGPLIRAQVLRLGLDDHVLLLTLHHIISDAWSSGIVFRELGVFYDAFRAGREPVLPPLPVQYADYAVWQREFLQGERLAKEVDYWREYLHAPLPPLRLPTDFPRPSVQTRRGGGESLLLTPELKAGLLRVSQRSGTTLFVTLLAIFQSLVHRWSGQEDVCVGFPSAGRTRAETEGLIGFFINTLTVRTRLAEATGFLDLLGQVKRGVLGAQAHQNVPFEKLVEVLQPTRDLARSPVFQVLFNMLPSGGGFALSDLSVEGVGRRDRDSKFDLTLYAKEGKAGIGLNLVYNADLFRPERMQAFLEQFRVVAEQVVQNPDRPLSGFSLLTPKTRSVIPDPGAPLSAARQPLVADLIARWALDAPEHAAVRHGSQRWSYGDLAAQAEEVGRTLAAKGVNPGTVVALSGAPSFGLIAGMLGVLQCGGVLLLIDPALPDGRKSLMLEEAAAGMLVSVGDGADEASWAPAAIQRVAMSPETGHVESRNDSEASAQQPEPGRTAADPAYVFFTSGTTGRPKGIVGSHQSLSHFLTWQRDTFEITPADRVAQLTGLSFDVVLRDILLPLVSGATLCLPDEADRLDGERLLRWLDREGITVLHTVPAVANAWLAQVPEGISLSSLRWVFFAGEPLTDQQVRAWRAAFSGGGEQVNLYGTTETTLAKCYYRIPDEPLHGVQSIGGPMPDTQALIMNRDQRVCGIGELGEIVIRTAFRTLGPLPAQGSTSAFFRQNPYRTQSPPDLYFTGDLGRYRPDGTVEILGRVDDQVKIRGVRIEPSEVMSALATHPAVQACFVMARADETGAATLVAYAVPASDGSATAAELRAYLARRLPPAMVPGSFVFLEAMPYTPNGKVDRVALPAPDAAEGQPEVEYVGPRTPAEERLAVIWQEVLNQDRIGVRDDFFALGGHSLLATQVIARVRKHFEAELPLRRFFEGPTIESLAAVIEDSQREGEASTAPALAPCSRAGTLPLSFAQQRLWFLDQLEPDQSAFNIAWTVRLTGVLDLGALELALSAIVDRHEVLRTTYATADDGEPVQVIGPAGAVDLAQVELSTLDSAERDAELRRQTDEQANRPFDLAAGPVLRATLYRLAAREHVLALVIHHIAYDAWSSGVLTREFGAFYSAFAEDREPALPALPVQYADYAAWQRQWLQGEALEAQLDYWRDQLGPAPTVLELPTDHPRPAQQTFRGTRERFVLSEALVASLRSLSQGEGVTLFMTLTAGLKALFHRYSGQSVITIGTPIANRTRRELEPLIGAFINNLVLRTKLEGGLSFREAVARVREVSVGAYAHQDLPFEQLVEALRPPRDRSRHPLFQVMFALQNVPRGATRLPGLELSGVLAARSSSQFDLTLFAREGHGRLYLVAEYNTDLFERETIRRLLRHYETLLAGAVADPDRAISRLSLMGEGEHARLLEVGQGPAAADTAATTLSGLFEAQAGRMPEAVAVVCDGERLSYRELDERANRLARHLQTLGLGPGALVGVCLERSVEMLVGLLGILKTGAAYLPLDPGFPAERLAYMLADAGVRVLVTQESLREDLSAHPAEVVSLDGDASSLAAYDAHALASDAGPEDLAYVIYTSGSTGRPKGVEIPHRAVVNFLQSMKQTPGLGQEDVLLAVTTLSFDIAVLELFLPLACGARVVVASRETAVDAEALAALMDSAGATAMQATPTTWRLLLESGWSGDGRLKAMIGGEAWGWDLAAPLLERCGSLWNMYGPTETTIWSAVRRVQAGDERVSISGPIADTRLYVLDEHLEPTPIGVPGELYIGGAGLARGYWNRPELTAERFVPSPFDPERRLYRTGDQVRYRADGSLEFMGRLDHQVKLRGYRIELGEIEAVLAQHADVQQAVVLVREDVPGDQRLVAYLQAEGEPDTSELRDLARSRLPEYMVPMAWVTLDSFPLTPNRKVDRKALPAPEGSGVEAGVEYVAPRTPDETAVAEIWAEVLGIERVGVRDNFFDIGGHSLLALRIRAAMEKKFERDVPLAILFQAPTIERLAGMLGEGFQPSAWTSLVPMQTEGTNPPFFCVPEAGSTIYSLSDLARHLGPNQPFYGLQPVGMDEDRAPHTRIEDMAAHYVREIKELRPEGPYLLGGQCFGAEVAFEVAQQLRAQGEEVALLALIGDNLIAGWARKGVETTDSAYSLTHSLQRAFYYLRRFPLGDVFRTARRELNIRLNPRLQYTRRVFKAQLLARTRYVRKPYPGRVTAFKPYSPLRRRFSKATMAGLAQGGVDLQGVPPAGDRLLHEPHVQVVAANLRACIRKVLEDEAGTASYAAGADSAQVAEEREQADPQVAAADASASVPAEAGAAPATETRPDLSLVLPCHNEASHLSDNVREIERALDDAELTYEIILIDDGSTDGTAEQIRSCLTGQRAGNVRASFHEATVGRGATIAAGIRLARSRYVGFMDISLETPPQFIPAAIDPLERNVADMVLGDRRTIRGLDAPLQLTMSRLFRWLASRLLKTDSLDTAAGFKFFRRDAILPVLDELTDSHSLWDTELTVVARARGLRAHSLPVSYVRRPTGQAAGRMFREAWSAIISLLAFAKRRRLARQG